MVENNKFYDLFPNTPVIGMMHLAGTSPLDREDRALEELAIYEEEGVDGAIIEDYHGSPEDVYNVLKESNKQGFKIIRGVNVLSNPYSGFELADRFGARFIQFDSVQTQDLDLRLYDKLRGKYPDILVLGGVGFKYTSPTGNPLEQDLKEAKSRCDAIVTTGSGTGVETPIEKLRKFKELLGDFPLVDGAGVNLDNVYGQLQICNGAIVGSYFKPRKDTHQSVKSQRVRDFMDIIRQVREYKLKNNDCK